MLSCTATVALLLTSANALVRPDEVGRLPALGWNSWNAYGCDVDETKIVEAASNINSTGLQALGYEYVNIDDCWSVQSGRDNVTHRIIPDPEKFPSGINGTAKQIHDFGLKLGIYSSAGTETCAGYPASIGYEDIDAQAFAEWGVDSIWDDEYNACVPDSDFPGVNPDGTCPDLEDPAPPGYDWATSNTTKRYNRMRDALVAVQDTRVILFSLCEWGNADVVSWGNGTGNSWRVSGDINATWDRITAIANLNAHELDSVDFFGFNDPDMLEVGNGNLTIEENRSHYALWAIMKSPLIIGTDLSTLPDSHLSILKNADLIAFNQDPVIGKPAFPYKDGYANGTWNPQHPPEYWSGSTSYGWDLVLLLNSQNVSATRTAVWSEIPQLHGKAHKVEDVWTGKDLGCIKDEYSVELQAHDVAVFKITGTC
ncbi:putative alpha-galactosidase B [Talaromyces atroroseus]|uniref:Alpha-galactosidase n=1 Tax=Talaromyces atroroseus TaxID=1441469 RepID=A0A225AUU5_TALAT|nr:putative alpha-galactosidase B [Talaromyces atroroseus]OKL64710.1 putative alpha-galactosidase B [Talaromyces atroroseus]